MTIRQRASWLETATSLKRDISERSGCPANRLLRTGTQLAPIEGIGPRTALHASNLGPRRLFAAVKANYLSSSGLPSHRLFGRFCRIAWPDLLGHVAQSLVGLLRSAKAAG